VTFAETHLCDELNGSIRLVAAIRAIAPLPSNCFIFVLTDCELQYTLCVG